LLDEYGELLGDGAPPVVEAHFLMRVSIGVVLVHYVGDMMITVMKGCSAGRHTQTRAFVNRSGRCPSDGPADVEILDPKEGESIYDPACGTGGMLLGAIEHVTRKGAIREPFSARSTARRRTSPLRPLRA
jgi:hypothetical protein